MRFHYYIYLFNEASYIWSSETRSVRSCFRSHETQSSTATIALRREKSGWVIASHVTAGWLQKTTTND